MSDPTPQQIQERCREIQSQWTPTQRNSRKTVRIPGVVIKPDPHIPIVRVSNIAGLPIDICREMEGWLFLTDEEAAYGKPFSSENCEEGMEDEEEELIHYEVVTVCFGN